MFDSEFYPTSNEAWEAMNVDCYGKRVLDPSAGKGTILKHAMANGAISAEGIEKQPELRLLLSSQFHCIGTDWFETKQEDISHVQMILMNPPYSNAYKHILHAWKIAPEGCEIISQCNAETLNKNNHRSNDELHALIRDYGDSSVVGQLYKTAERTTDVEIGIIRLFKPMTADNPEFEGFHYDLEAGNEVGGVIRYNDIQAIVNNYTGAVRCFDKFETIGRELNSICRAVDFGSYGGYTFKVSHDKGIANKAEFAKELQKHCWKEVFKKFDIEKFLTKGVMSDLNKFVESRLNYPFTMKNIFRMIEILVGTSGSNMEKAIVEAVDNFTRHTDENRYSVEGWKTNSGHMLNKRFITPYICETRYKWDTHDYVKINRWGGNFDSVMDLTKALCFLTGTDFKTIPCITDISDNKFDPNTWYNWGFFRFKVYKKGTGHFEFLSDDVWGTLNLAYGKAKGNPLPENTFKTKSKKKEAYAYA